MFRSTSLLFLIFLSSSSFGSFEDCNRSLKGPEESTAIMECFQAKCSPVDLSHRVSAAATEKFPLKKGYAVLVGAMIGSAALTTFLTSHLPKDLVFLSQLVGQLSTLGIYVFGSPIWEPLSSWFRKMAFGVSQLEVTSIHGEKGLEEMWLRTQKSYSVNAQMSRNIISLFISSTRQNFYEAFQAMHSQNKDYAAIQIAEAAIRLRTLFKDISPQDPFVSMAVKTAFVERFPTSEIRSLVWEKIQTYDPAFADPAAQEYYFELINAWFSPN